MKFISYLKSGQKYVGVLGPEETEVRELDVPIGGLVSLIREGISAREQLNMTGTKHRYEDIEFLAPLPLPERNIFCVGKNYTEHAAEFSVSGFDSSSSQGDAVPEHPIFFTKAPSAVIGPGDVVDLHDGITNALDYEAEIAVIIGRGGRQIPKEDALSHVWGYTLINDITARDLQHRHKQWFLGKSLDTFCPMGPWAVTADEVDGPLTIECHVNGELRQRATTKDLIFDIPTLIATLSAGISLQPGDIIATGTPVGVGIGFDPPKFLQPGDRITVSAEGLGTLENTVGSPTS